MGRSSPVPGGATVEEIRQFESVRQRFPAYRHLLDTLLESHEDLRGACHNYEDCLVALANPQMTRFRDRFLSIRHLIEEEILDYLEEAAAEVDPPVVEHEAVTVP